MKVYVITKGEYSDYHICAVSFDRNEADILKDRFSDRWDEANIEEYDTDDNAARVKNGKICHCWYWPLGDKILVEETDDNVDKINEIIDCGETLEVYVYADSEDGARKIASEKFAKFMAEKLGL